MFSKSVCVIDSEAMITFEDSSEGKSLKLYDKKFEMAKGFAEKVDGPVTLIDYEQKMPRRHSNSQVSIDKAKTILSYEPKIDAT